MHLHDGVPNTRAKAEEERGVVILPLLSLHFTTTTNAQWRMAPRRATRGSSNPSEQPASPSISEDEDQPGIPILVAHPSTSLSSPAATASTSTSAFAQSRTTFRTQSEDLVHRLRTRRGAGNPVEKDELSTWVEQVMDTIGRPVREGEGKEEQWSLDAKRMVVDKGLERMLFELVSPLPVLEGCDGC